MVDLFYALYGSKKPKCLQYGEMANIFKDFIKESSPSSPNKNQSPTTTSTSTIPKNKGLQQNEYIFIDDDAMTVMTKNEPGLAEDTPSDFGPSTSNKRSAAEAFDDTSSNVKPDIVDDTSCEIVKVESCENVTKLDFATEFSSFQSEAKKLKTDDFSDENTISLSDGTSMAGGNSSSFIAGINRFEQEMFRQEEESKTTTKSESSSTKVFLYLNKFSKRMYSFEVSEPCRQVGRLEWFLLGSHILKFLWFKFVDKDRLDSKKCFF